MGLRAIKYVLLLLLMDLILVSQKQERNLHQNKKTLLNLGGFFIQLKYLAGLLTTNS